MDRAISVMQGVGMKAATKIIISIVVIAGITAGVLLFTQKDAGDTKTSSSTSDTTTGEATITYTSDGFSPASVTVSAGSKVTFVNQTDQEIEPSSGPHPVHTSNSELNAGDIEPGKSKSVTLTTKGTWSIHNHYDHDKTATVTVQ